MTPQEKQDIKQFIAFAVNEDKSNSTPFDNVVIVIAAIIVGL